MTPLTSIWSTKKLNQSPTWLWLMSRARQLQVRCQLKKPRQKCVRRPELPIWHLKFRARGHTWISLKHTHHKIIHLIFNIRRLHFLLLLMRDILHWEAPGTLKTAWWCPPQTCRSINLIWERQWRKCQHLRDLETPSKLFSLPLTSLSRQLEHSLQSPV